MGVIGKYEDIVSIDKVKHALKLIYYQRDYGPALDFVHSELSINSIEYVLFRARILADTGNFAGAMVMSSELVKCDDLSRLFYLLDYANDNIVLDLVNIGHKLRGRDMIEKSDAYMKLVYKAQHQRKLITRTTVVQRLIDQSKDRLYLEIGVFVGHNFLQIDANKKVAVDPVCRIKHTDAFPGNALFYEVPSDQFFKEKMDDILDEKLDVIFIDGLHTYQQSLNDVLNALEFLKDDGVIVMHDCFPKTKAAAHPVQEEAQEMETFQGFWNGDVFKSILWLRSNRPDLEVLVLNADHGLGIVRKRKAESMLSLTDEAIEQMTYEEFAIQQISLLNLKPKEYFNVWL